MCQKTTFNPSYAKEIIERIILFIIPNFPPLEDISSFLEAMRKCFGEEEGREKT